MHRPDRRGDGSDKRTVRGTQASPSVHQSTPTAVRATESETSRLHTANANKALIKESSTPRGDATTFGRARRRHGRATLTRFEV